MADQVHFHLEEMLPELQDLEDKGIFSKQEIKSIVKKRTAFEYAMHRRIPKQSDFLQYIEYEKSVEKLRIKRKLRMTADDMKGVKVRSVSDYSIVRRIHSLYQKTLKKYKGDVELWLQYFEWSKAIGSSKALGRSFARAIQLHPTNPAFWILAACWEYEENSNMKSARILLQRGLRINQSSHKLWIEYFKLELLYVQKLIERRRVLLQEGLSSDESIEEKSNELTQESDDHESVNLPTLPIERDQMSSTDQIVEEDDASKAKRALLEVMIPRAVYRNAIEAIPNDIAFRQSFLDVYHLFGKDASIKGIEEVRESIQRDFPDDPRAFATLVYDQHMAGLLPSNSMFPDALKKSVNAFQQLLADSPSSGLWVAYTSFLKDQLDVVNAHQISALSKYIKLVLSTAYKNASDSCGCCSEEMYMAWIHLVQDESLSEHFDITALEVAQCGLAVHPFSVGLWIQKARHMETVQDSIACFEDAIKSLSNPSSRSTIWKEYLDYILAENGGLSPESVETVFQNAMLDVKGTVEEPSICGRYLELLIASCKDDASRYSVSKWSLASSSLYQKEFYKKSVKLEASALDKFDVGSNVKQALMVELAKSWESLVNCDRSDMESWLGYIHVTMEVSKDYPKASNLYSVALKAVVDSDAFEAAYQQIMK